MGQYVKHKRSSSVVNNAPKLPTTDNIEIGEIAINFADGYETLSILNSSSGIATFSSDKILDGKYALSGNVKSAIASLSGKVESNEFVVAEAINDLNDRMPTDVSIAASGYTKNALTAFTETDPTVPAWAKAANKPSYTASEVGAMATSERSNYLSTGTTYFDDAEYDSNTKRINFKKNNTVVDYIDATDFIKDGMVSSVTVSNGNLVISFNTEAGREDIELALTQIFNPNNYYDKTTADGKFLTSADTKLKVYQVTVSSFNGVQVANALPSDFYSTVVADSDNGITTVVKVTSGNETRDYYLKDVYKSYDALSFSCMYGRAQCSTFQYFYGDRSDIFDDMFTMGGITGVTINNSAATVSNGRATFNIYESDPTVPSWAKEANKPSYTASEVGALPTGTTLDNIADGSTRKLSNYSLTNHTHSNYATTGNVNTLSSSTQTHVNNGAIHLPSVSATDNGKILQVVNGQWVLITPTTVYTGNGTPDNTLGNNGDIYLQTS